jgi:hypothetical protein
VDECKPLAAALVRGVNVLKRGAKRGALRVKATESARAGRGREVAAKAETAGRGRWRLLYSANHVIKLCFNLVS